METEQGAGATEEDRTEVLDSPGRPRPCPTSYDRQLRSDHLRVVEVSLWMCVQPY